MAGGWSHTVGLVGAQLSTTISKISGVATTHAVFLALTTNHLHDIGPVTTTFSEPSRPVIVPQEDNMQRVA